jgi:hypothetical protein
MSILSKKIASKYMQKQAGISLIAFPSVMSILKEVTFKEEVSKAIIEGLNEIFIDCIQFSNTFDYNSKIVNREIIEDDGVLITSSGKYFQDTGWEEETKFGALGQNLVVAIQVSAKDVSEHLAEHLNSQARSYLTSKVMSLQLFHDLQSGQFMNAIAMKMKAELKNIKFDNVEINEFVVNNGFDVDYVSKNGFDDGKQYFQHGYLTLKEVQWAKGNLSFLVEIEEYYHVEGTNY